VASVEATALGFVEGQPEQLVLGREVGARLVCELAGEECCVHSVVALVRD
jgi:hypothetical protein